MLCKNKLTNLDFKSKKNNAKHILLPFSFFYLFFNFKKKKQKQSQNEMHECYAMQILETKNKEDKNNKEEWSPRIE